MHYLPISRSLMIVSRKTNTLTKFNNSIRRTTEMRRRSVLKLVGLASDLLTRHCRFIVLIRLIDLVMRCFVCFSTIRFQLIDECLMVKDTTEGQSMITAYFQSPSYVISRGQRFQVSHAIAHFAERVEKFSKLGSGYRLQHIKRLYASIIIYNPLRASSHIPTPRWIQNKSATINIQNTDQKCFLWSVLCGLHTPARGQNAYRVSIYKRFEDTLDMSGIRYPV